MIQIEHKKLKTEVENLRSEKTKLDKELSGKQATVKKLTKQIKDLKPYIDPRSQGAIRDFDDLLRDEVKDRSSLIGGGKIVTDKGWRNIHHWASQGISNAYAAEVYQEKARTFEKENKELSKKVEEMQPHHEKRRLVLRSPYRAELGEIECKASIWSEKQNQARIEANMRVREAVKERERSVLVYVPVKTQKNEEHEI